jgi:uncharacterized protein
MTEQITFHRVGAAPGRKPELVAVPWQATDIPRSDGMTPIGCQYYADASGRVSSGIWACNAGNVEIKDNPVEEVCFVLQGTVKVTDHRGRSETFGPGECLVLPRGFNGLWSQSDGFQKFYAVVETA